MPINIKNQGDVGKVNIKDVGDVAKIYRKTATGADEIWSGEEILFGDGNSDLSLWRGYRNNSYLSYTINQTWLRLYTRNTDSPSYVYTQIWSTFNIGSYSKVTITISSSKGDTDGTNLLRIRSSPNGGSILFYRYDPNGTITIDLSSFANAYIDIYSSKPHGYVGGGNYVTITKIILE